MDDILKLYQEISKLKTLLRSGWVQRGVAVERLESVAEHCFSMGFLALVIAKKENQNLDMAKVFGMILAHEIGEIDSGDITPADNISIQQKFELEFNGAKRISNLLDDNHLLSLWLEFEQNQTPEAQFVKKIDKLDAVMQSKIYSNQISDPKLFTEFFTNAKNTIGHYSKIFD